MNNTQLKTSLEIALQPINSVWADEAKTELAHNFLLDKLEKYDPEMMAALLNNADLKCHFFVEIAGVLVFKKSDFQFFLSQSKVNHSYTKYKNRIGLTDGSRFLKDCTDIVLDFPFKDCVLNGGQSTEEGDDVYFERNSQPASQLYTKLSTKRKEIFFNQILAFDEIDRLFDKKALSKFTRHTENGIEIVDEFKRHEDGTLAENLIIKGNNLIALHSLYSLIHRKLLKKVKLIYIDPPYYFHDTKPSDTFNYNSNFKLSSWLLFMKNRLEIARELLSDNGVILVNINEAGNAYLKILMNDIFGKDNFVETFIWKNTDNPDSLSKKSRSSVEYIIAFEKKINKSVQYIGKNTENDDAPLLNSGNKYKSLTFPAGSIRFTIPDGQINKHKSDKVEIVNDFEIKNGLNVQNVTLRGEFKWSQSTLDTEINLGTYFLVKSNKFSIRFKRANAKSMAPEKFINEVYLSKALGVGTNEDATTHLKNMGLTFSNPKPESLIAFFVNAITQPDDLILDFFVGSGTTAAVAHKMNRQYIGIEQMDYIETLAVERLKKVIANEQGGISKAVSWQGGGDFVYAELTPFNETAKQQILDCENLHSLKILFTTLCDKYFLKYNVNVQNFTEIIMEESEFQSLSLDEQKQMVLEMLDLNQMYVNFSEIDDGQLSDALSESDKKLNHDFYGE